jgi:5-methylthioadenosine/S-adenosylhomocysteine deaminase
LSIGAANSTDQVIFSNRATRRLEDGSTVIEPAVIGIDGDTIAFVRPMSREAFLDLEFEASVKVVDVGERLLTPAFINAHTHLPMIAFRSIGGMDAFQGNVVEELYFRMEQHIEAADVRAFTRVGAYESLLSGVGCVWEHYYFAEEIAEALLEVGLSGVIAPTLQDRAGPGVRMLDEQLAATEAIDGSERLRSAGIVSALGPHATDTVSSELWAEVRRVATARNLPIHAHVSQSIEEFERSVLEFGCSPIERLQREGTLAAGPSMLLVHSLFASERDIGLLEGGRHVLGYCPYSQLQFGFPAPISAWRAQDIPIALGTDCAACNDTMNVQRELRIYAGGGALETTHGVELAGFMRSGRLEDAQRVWASRSQRFDESVACDGPAKNLESVWSVPGAMHPGLPLGELRAGYRANLLVWDLEHPGFWPRANPLRALTLSDITPAIWGMTVNGRWLGRRGEFQQSILGQVEYRDAIAEADERLRALMARI